MASKLTNAPEVALAQNIHSITKDQYAVELTHSQDSLAVMLYAIMTDLRMQFVPVSGCFQLFKMKLPKADSLTN